MTEAAARSGADGLLPGPRTRWFGPALALVTALAFVGRYLYLVRSRVDRGEIFRQGDAVWYSVVSANSATGRWFVNPFYSRPTADHAPGTVIALWPSTWFGDPSTWKQRVTMVILGSLVVLVVGLAGRVIAGPIAGIAAAIIAAVNPSLWVNDALIMSETPTALVVALLLLATFLAYRLRGRARPHRFVIAGVLGVLCAMCALTRAETGLLLPLVVWPVFLSDRSFAWRGRLAAVAVATVALGATIAPWTLYNTARFNAPVFISTNDGLTLMCANTDTTWNGPIKGSWTTGDCLAAFKAGVDERKGAAAMAGPEVVCPDADQHRAPCWDDSQLSPLMRSEGLSYIRHHLSEWPGVTWARNGRVWGWYQPDQAKAAALEGRPIWTAWPTWWSLWALLAVSGAGLWVARRRRIPISPFLGTLAAVVFVTTAFYGLPRFRIPVDVSLCLLSGLAISALVQRSAGWPGGIGAFPTPTDTHGSGSPDPAAGDVPVEVALSAETTGNGPEDGPSHPTG